MSAPRSSTSGRCRGEGTAETASRAWSWYWPAYFATRAAGSPMPPSGCRSSATPTVASIFARAASARARTAVDRRAASASSIGAASPIPATAVDRHRRADPGALGRRRVADRRPPRVARRSQPECGRSDGQDPAERTGTGSRPRHAASSLAPMILRMSSLFVRTLREDPADAEVPSHRLLVRAGYIRRAAPGIYTWLPLGLRVLRNDRAHRPRGDGRDRRPGAALPGAAARASPTRRPAAGPSTATASSGSRTARAPTTCSGPPTRRCSRSW